MAYGMLQVVPLAIVAAMFALFILSGLGNRTKQAAEYGFGGGNTGRAGIGAGIASNWMSAASFLGLAGVFYLKGYFAMAYVVGWTGGYVLLLVLMATQIRRFGKYTTPDFVGFRYESDTARILAALISMIISVIYCVAQFRGIALLVSWLFGRVVRRRFWRPGRHPQPETAVFRSDHHLHFSADAPEQETRLFLGSPPVRLRCGHRRTAAAVRLFLVRAVCRHNSL